jgi:NADH:ubiquinone oxidoreductase subunit K
MLGPLSPEERRAVRSFFWSAPMRKAQITVLIGVSILFFATAWLMVLEFTVPPHSGITASDLVLLALLPIGAAVMVVGVALRGRTFRRTAVRPCPNCGQPNLWISGFCRACGTPLLGATAAGPAEPPLPTFGLK